ncbi:MAG: hypothetical protein ACFCD0_14330 [Gemmataceae bacterium]
MSQHDSNASQQRQALRCIHLTCKSMAVFGEDFEQDPEYQAGMVEFECIKTTGNIGPDRGDVSMEYCCNSKRRCYEAF